MGRWEAAGWFGAKGPSHRSIPLSSDLHVYPTHPGDWGNSFSLIQPACTAPRPTSHAGRMFMFSRILGGRDGACAERKKECQVELWQLLLPPVGVLLSRKKKKKKHRLCSRRRNTTPIEILTHSFYLVVISLQAYASRKIIKRAHTSPFFKFQTRFQGNEYKICHIEFQERCLKGCSAAIRKLIGYKYFTNWNWICHLGGFRGILGWKYGIK